ncbi:MAG: hypothetical protein L3J39_11765 [Verrucomicrobiales bacterium]|nr:hypothetical protein [Verrucomicrobiales bacterium]
MPNTIAELERFRFNRGKGARGTITRVVYDARALYWQASIVKNKLPVHNQVRK